MHRSPAWRIAAALVALAGVLSPAVAGDAIRVHNTRFDEVGAFVDGMRGGVVVNDASYLKLKLGGFFGGVFPAIPLDRAV